MIWNPENSKGMKLVDSSGTFINYAFEFNDETFEVKFYLTGIRDGKNRIVVGDKQTITASAIVPGAKMVPRDPA